MTISDRLKDITNLLNALPSEKTFYIQRAEEQKKIISLENKISLLEAKTTTINKKIVSPDVIMRKLGNAL